MIEVIFIDKNGGEIKVQAQVGVNLLTVAHENKIPLEGACEGSLACSTCHVIVDQNWFDRDLSEISDDENDMLDMAFELTETSRLGCQIILTKRLNGLRVRLPSATRNISNNS